MTHVVTENCDRCRYTECVTVCPVDCFRGDAERLYIVPEECIDCGACVPQCPVRAIVDSFDLRPEQEGWIETNRSRSTLLPVVRERTAPLATAAERRSALGY